MKVKIKPYLKKLSYSYTLGIYPTLELLLTKPDIALELIINPKFAKTNKSYKKILQLAENLKLPILTSAPLIQKIAVKENTLVVGIFKKFNSAINVQNNHIVLVEPRNRGNVGTIIRSMVGFGFKDLVLIGNAVDIFSPDIVRSTMGALFKIKVTKLSSFTDYLNLLNLRERCFYPFILYREAIRLQRVFQPCKSKYSLIFGNEGAGLKEDLLSVLNSSSDSVVPVFIDQNKDIDSLNLSVSASIAMYHFSVGLGKDF